MRYALIGQVIASRLQTALHLQDSYCACPKIAESIGQQEKGRDKLMKDSCDTSNTTGTEAANNTQGTSKAKKEVLFYRYQDESIGQV